MNRKRIYVCCGTGIATSTVIVKKVSEFLDENNIQYDISQYIVSDIPSKVANKKPDIVISSTTISADLGDVPVLLGRSFLTGIGRDKTKQELREILEF
ncbi:MULTISPECIES: PTS sugar transporter subunit IIB [Enterococcus]|uniref:PTS system, galactitol-specific IIB component n=1 Tax=Candidatus Enterococcus ferrettii TaxID=2815324 RepID=A0ABV0EX79_9ENTE|nr:PTS sugar transporter subunit IIB [Enterococcus sp. 665A]MBO1339509.1 PTS sugar transporter subunit IIB [Enterococcus sp. 665A]